MDLALHLLYTTLESSRTKGLHPLLLCINMPAFDLNLLFEDEIDPAADSEAMNQRLMSRHAHGIPHLMYTLQPYALFVDQQTFYFVSLQFGTRIVMCSSRQVE